MFLPCVFHNVAVVFCVLCCEFWYASIILFSDKLTVQMGKKGWVRARGTMEETVGLSLLNRYNCHLRMLYRT